MITRFHRMLIASLLGVIWLSALVVHDWPDGQFHVWLLDIGQGDAILVQEASGAQILIDGGPGDQIIPALSARMPFWDRTIERVVLSHPHADHLDGLVEVAKRYTIGEVWVSGAEHTTPDYQAWEELLRARDIPVRFVGAGQRVTRGDLRFEFLHPIDGQIGQVPAEQHDATVVARLVMPQGSILLTGDIDEGHERDILDAWCPPPVVTPCPALQSTVLKVPHHGSRSGLLPEFLTAVAPQAAIISVGEGNAYGHPHPTILERLAAQGIAIYRTDHDQTIELRVRDGQLIVEPD